MIEIDVNECRYYEKSFCGLYKDCCSECDYCDYRQLQQLKQENEKLKKQLGDTLKLEFDFLQDKLFLEQKFEKIKGLVIVLLNICLPFVKDCNDSMKVVNEILQIIENGNEIESENK